VTPGEERSILVVDDDDGHTELVRRNLRRVGVKNPIEILRNGTDALAYVFSPTRGAAPLLMILDINMPGMDGIEVLTQIKNDPRTATIPVVMLTTTDDPRDVVRCHAAGCNLYVTKPVDPAAFVHAIERLGMLLEIARVPRSPARPG